MKKFIINGLVALTLLGTTTSCEKWLDVTASDQINADDLFETRGGFRDALLGVYVGMGTPGLYGGDLSFLMVEMLAKQYTNRTELSVSFDLDNYRYGAVRAQSRIKRVWDGHYANIANINLALKYIDQNRSVLSNIEYSIIKGELLGLRAFSHFELMRLFGYGDLADRPELLQKWTIPYVTALSKDQTDQRSYAQTFTLLEKDLTDALELLKEDPAYPNPQRPSGYYEEANRDGLYNNRELRMNYFAVKALQARVLQWQGKKQAAATAAEEVINQSSAQLSAPGVPARNNHILREEHLFGLQITGFNLISQSYWDLSSTTNYEALYTQRGVVESVYEVSNPNVGVADIRFNTLLQDLGTGIVTAKYNLTGPGGGTDIVPLIKLPEMYYIAADYYRATDPVKAVGYLNAVRASRSIQQPIGTNISPDQIWEELVKEYQKEYYAEGQLFYFYKRNGLTQLPGQSANLVMTDATYVLPYPEEEITVGNRVQF